MSRLPVPKNAATVIGELSSVRSRPDRKMRRQSSRASRSRRIGQPGSASGHRASDNRWGMLTNDIMHRQSRKLMAIPQHDRMCEIDCVDRQRVRPVGGACGKPYQTCVSCEQEHGGERCRHQGSGTDHRCTRSGWIPHPGYRAAPSGWACSRQPEQAECTRWSVVTDAFEADMSAR